MKRDNVDHYLPTFGRDFLAATEVRVMKSLDADWNVDAFHVDQETLRRHCKSVAGRLNGLASVFGQESDVTPRRLENLYHAQRGRCAILGVPLFKVAAYDRRKGVLSVNEHPFEIELDHIQQIDRGSAIRMAAKGKASSGGMVAKLSNLRWVSRIGHVFRHWIDGKAIREEELAQRILLAARLGKPWNCAVNLLDDDESKNRDGVELCDFIREFLRSRKYVPGVDVIVGEARSAGFSVTTEKMWQMLRKQGIDLVRYKRENRIDVIAGRLQQDQQLLSMIQESKITIRAAHEILNNDLRLNGLRCTSTLVFARDLRSALSRFVNTETCCSEACDYLEGKQRVLFSA